MLIWGNHLIPQGPEGGYYYYPYFTNIERQSQVTTVPQISQQTVGLDWSPAILRSALSFLRSRESTVSTPRGVMDSAKGGWSGGQVRRGNHGGVLQKKAQSPLQVAPEAPIPCHIQRCSSPLHKMASSPHIGQARPLQMT